MRSFKVGAALLAVMSLAGGCGSDDRAANAAAGDTAVVGTPAFGDTALRDAVPDDGNTGLPTAPPVAPGAGPPPTVPQPPGTGTSGSGGSVGQAAPPASAPPAPSGGAAQPDASRILQEASDRYGEVRSLRANFTMRTTNPLLRSTTTSRGILYQVRPDRLALRFTDPDGDIMLADGRYFWAYYPSVNAQQVLRSPAAAGGGASVDLQAHFLGDPVRRFEHTLDGREAVDGRDAFVMTLVPRSTAEFTRLRVWIDAQDRLVRRFEVTETNGVERSIQLDALQVNANVPASVFEFTPPAGARVIERG